MLTKTRAIVLRVAPYNDKSSIIYMYTEAFGRCSYVMTWPRGRSCKIPRSRDREPDQGLFDYLAESVALLERLDQGIANFHIVFLMGLTRFLGIFPNLEGYRPGVLFDLREGAFTDRLPTHPDYLGPRESEVFYSLLRIRYGNMALYAFSRQERVSILRRIIDYYRLHLPEFPEIHSLAIFQDLFD